MYFLTRVNTEIKEESTKGATEHNPNDSESSLDHGHVKHLLRNQTGVPTA